MHSYVLLSASCFPGPCLDLSLSHISFWGGLEVAVFCGAGGALRAPLPRGCV